MAKKKQPIAQPKPEPEKKPKSFLDKPIKEIFSFNVDNEIRDNADRSRNIIANFERNGITITRRKKSLNNATMYLLIMLVAIVFLIIVTPFAVVKTILIVIGFGVVWYYLSKLKHQ